MKGKTALLFPGQGTQSVGMGQDLVAAFARADQLFKTAEEVTGLPLAKICREGPAETLDQTIYSQPAIFTVSSIIYLLLAEEGIFADLKPAASAGHSLGEYTALLAAGVASFPDLLQVVAKRAAAMQEAAKKSAGGMAAVLGMESNKVDEILKQVSPSGQEVCVANYNSPIQTVISGEQNALARAMSLLQEGGAKKIVPLAVSGPFHSPYMKEAGQTLAGVLEKIPFHEPLLSFLPNVAADYTDQPDQIKKMLVEQVSGSVRWWPTMEKLLGNGYQSFIEVGPGRVLTGLLKKVGGLELVNVGDAASLTEFIKGIRNKSGG